MINNSIQNKDIKRIDIKENNDIWIWLNKDNDFEPLIKPHVQTTYHFIYRNGNVLIVMPINRDF